MIALTALASWLTLLVLAAVVCAIFVIAFVSLVSQDDEPLEDDAGLLFAKYITAAWLLDLEHQLRTGHGRAYPKTTPDAEGYYTPSTQPRPLDCRTCYFILAPDEWIRDQPKARS